MNLAENCPRQPAQETCEQCHWPRAFVGNLDRAISYYLPDQSNTLYTVRLLLKVGGGDPTHGPVGGIHWHMNVANKIEYIATDAARQKIPWVRLTDAQGVVTVFRTAGFTNDVSRDFGCWRGEREAHIRMDLERVFNEASGQKIKRQCSSYFAEVPNFLIWPRLPAVPSRARRDRVTQSHG